MAGPGSMPSGDRKEYEFLREMRCDAHGEYCYGDGEERKTPHVMITWREWLLKRNRLRTGKTR